MVRRDVFDYFLVTQAVKQGATLKDTTKVRGVEFVSNGWIVKTENESFKGRYLIGADGAKGSMAKWLGFGKQKKIGGGCIGIRNSCTEGRE